MNQEGNNFKMGMISREQIRILAAPGIWKRQRNKLPPGYSEQECSQHLGLSPVTPGQTANLKKSVIINL